MHDGDSELNPELFDQVTQSVKAQKRLERKAKKEERQYKRNPKPLTPRSKNQRIYIDSLIHNELTIAIGPAGVGKTYVPARIYGEMLLRGDIEKLYVARPNVAKPRHRMGYLPGSADEKTAPWLIPIFEGIMDSMSKADFERFRKAKAIEEVPYEHIQGRTFREAAWIVDEAENLDLDDLYITLTRQGENLRMALCGDIEQARIVDSGLQYVVDMAAQPHMRGIGIVAFDEADVVRSRQARQWVKAFNNHKKLSNPLNGDLVAHTDFMNNTPKFLTRI